MAQGDQQARILRADGEAKAIERVFQAVHRNDADPKLLAYKYLETLPELADGKNNTFWVIPGEFTEAMRTITGAFGDHADTKRPAVTGPVNGDVGGASQIGHDEIHGAIESLDAVRAADEVAKKAEAAVIEAKAEAKAVEAAAGGRR